jgi:alkylation response protein AidB-like acyl-CoA dehydrogenase
MNLALSDEQEFLKEAAQGALARVATIEAARAAIEDESQRPDLWPLAVGAGWPGLVIAEQRGGAGLGIFEALLIAEETGRALAGVPLLGLLPATLVLDAARDETCEAVASGERRPVHVPARPAARATDEAWSVDAVTGGGRGPALRARVSGGTAVVSGAAGHVVDAPGADLLTAVAVSESGAPICVVIEAAAEGVSVAPVRSYDATRALAHITLDNAPARVLPVDDAIMARAWYFAQALIAAESLGAVQPCLEMSVAYAQERFTFGRPIGSYQSIKHEIVEILRLMDNARSLQYFAGWSGESAPEEFALAASAARSGAGRALAFASRALINVHGGIGATWEHDAPLFFRRAQVSSRLVGGTHDASSRVASELLASTGTP